MTHRSFSNRPIDHSTHRHPYTDLHSQVLFIDWHAPCLSAWTRCPDGWAPADVAGRDSIMVWMMALATIPPESSAGGGGVYSVIYTITKPTVPQARNKRHRMQIFGFLFFLLPLGRSSRNDLYPEYSLVRSKELLIATEDVYLFSLCHPSHQCYFCSGVFFLEWLFLVMETFTAKAGTFFLILFFVPPVILVDMAVATLRYRLSMYWFTHLRSVGR